LLLGLTLEQAMVESFGWGGLARLIALLVIATVAPIVAAAAWARGLPIPPFERVLGRVDMRPQLALQLLLGIVVVALAVLSIQAALGLTFDPRYRDFPYAPLTAAVTPLVLIAARTKAGGTWSFPERLIAGILVLSAAYIVFNESFVNWQADWFCAVITVLAAILARAPDAQG
jgi:glucan 1,3-beta-glucosidase